MNVTMFLPVLGTIKYLTFLKFITSNKVKKYQTIGTVAKSNGTNNRNRDKIDTS